MESVANNNIDKYRVLRPYRYKESEIEAEHYLACGSYSSSIKLGRLACLSKYRIRGHTKFPVVKLQEGYQTVLIVTEGTLKVDGQAVRQGDVRVNPTDISGDEQNEAEFIRIVLKDEPQDYQLLPETGELYLSNRTSIRFQKDNKYNTLKLASSTFVLALSGNLKQEWSKLYLEATEGLWLRTATTVQLIKFPCSMLICSLL